VFASLQDASPLQFRPRAGYRLYRIGKEVHDLKRIKEPPEPRAATPPAPSDETEIRTWEIGEIKMSEDLELQRLRAGIQGDAVALEFLKWLVSYGILFRQCRENSDAPRDGYLREKNLSFSFPNCVTAYNELTKRGHRFLLDKLTPPVAVEAELPPLPEVPGMNPKIFTMTDIEALKSERYKKLYFGPNAAQFRARVNEIIRRAKEEK
jgi:hypothetical protein